jgi:hypothetical protein
VRKSSKDQRRKKKLAARKERYRQFERRPAVGPCKDCGRPCLITDYYIVKNETWAEAGMAGWASGHLHLDCLKKRLGRDLRDDELLAWCEGRSAQGWPLAFRAEYLSRPEYLDHH